MIRLEHRPALDGLFTHDGNDYEISDGIIEVDDAEVARSMAEHPRISIADVDATPTPDADESEESDDYPTNEDGEPLCVGKDDGQCSRVVDKPGGLCWQHSPE